MLTIKCPDGESKDSARVVGGIIDLFARRFSAFGLNGCWSLELLRKTGGGGQERLVFKRQTNGIFLYQARPLDRDSSWTVVVHPPASANLKTLLDKEQATPSQPEEVTPLIQISVCNEQVYKARVTAHLSHGLSIEIESKTGPCPGFIQLADIGFDKASINKYPVNKNIKVLVCDASKVPVVCSTRTDTVLTTTNANDMFTGRPTGDGSLSLKGFTASSKRILSLVEHLGVFSGGERIPKETAISITMEYLKAEYGGTAERQQIVTILNAMCNKSDAMPAATLSRTDEDYSLTSFALDELPHIKGEQPAPAPVAAVAEPEPEPEPAVAESEVAPQKTERIVPLDEVVEYLGKACRQAELKSQIEALSKEKSSLDEWLQANANVKVAAQALQRAVS